MSAGMKVGKSKTIILFVGLAIAIIFGVYFAFLLNSPNSRGNQATEITKPLEEELIAKGAKKICDGGDDGRGTDNRRPYYRAYLDLNLSKSDSIKLVSEAALNEGYSLTHASPSNRGFLGGVADIYIDKWYFDGTSKQSQYGDLKEGNIKLAVVIEATGSEDPCDSSKKVLEGHTIVGVEAQLPERK